jgi:hypothetical protein
MSDLETKVLPFPLSPELKKVALDAVREYLAAVPEDLY